MFSKLERSPDTEFGLPGPLVQELEANPVYCQCCRHSVRRQPTQFTSMVNRHNTTLPNETRGSWLAEL
jgi:hypothetical protein